MKAKVTDREMRDIRMAALAATARPVQKPTPPPPKKTGLWAKIVAVFGLVVMLIVIAGCKITERWVDDSVKEYKTVERLHMDDWGSYGFQVFFLRQLHYCPPGAFPNGCWNINSPGHLNGEDWEHFWCHAPVGVCATLPSIAAEAERQL